MKSLAVKYRPTTFDDVTEQGSIKTILTQQLETGTHKNAYLFCGGAGTGKTTCARIFAQELNKHRGNPIEMDAASNSGVDDVREIIEQAKKKSLDSDYKVFIIDECHSLTNQGWQAFLKLLEEPPASSIFVFCTTDPQKIPKTILSRVQRYDFQRISQEGIIHRLQYILEEEFRDATEWTWDKDAIEYLAKIADGGMRDAITLMDKCLSYSIDLTLDNVIHALGVVDYEMMFNLFDAICDNKSDKVIDIIERVHMSGKDLKQFVKAFSDMLLDICKYDVTSDFKYIQLPKTYETELGAYSNYEFGVAHRLLKSMISLNSLIKWETSPKPVIEATLLMEVDEKVHGTNSTV